LGAKVIFFPKTSKFFLHFFTTKTKKSYNCAKLSVKIVQDCTILSVKGRFYNLPIGINIYTLRIETPLKNSACHVLAQKVNIILKNSCIIFLRNRKARKQKVTFFNLTNTKTDKRQKNFSRNC